MDFFEGKMYHKWSLEYFMLYTNYYCQIIMKKIEKEQYNQNLLGLYGMAKNQIKETEKWITVIKFDSEELTSYMECNVCTICGYKKKKEYDFFSHVAKHLDSFHTDSENLRTRLLTYMINVTLNGKHDIKTAGTLFDKKLFEFANKIKNE